jgi:hypothetical protein
VMIESIGDCLIVEHGAWRAKVVSSNLTTALAVSGAVG